MYGALRASALLFMSVQLFAASISFDASAQVRAGVPDADTGEYLGDSEALCSDSAGQIGIAFLSVSLDCGGTPGAHAFATANDLIGEFSSYAEAFEIGDSASLSGGFSLSGYYNLSQGTGLQTVVVPALFRSGFSVPSCDFAINGIAVGCDGATIQLQAGAKHLVEIGFSFGYEVSSGSGSSAHGGYNLSSVFTPVPEPSTLAMIPAGLLAVAVYRRRVRG